MGTDDDSSAPCCTAVVVSPVYRYNLKSGGTVTVEQGSGDVGCHVWEGAKVLSRCAMRAPHMRMFQRQGGLAILRFVASSSLRPSWF